MKSRMDKYNDITSGISSRTEKNKELYENVRKSSMTEYEVKSNVSVIDESSNVINVSKIKELLDTRYNSDMPKRKTIELPKYEEEIPEETTYDTKEYDINAILSKAKQGKNVDYNKERLKKIRDAQYDILNNLDLELKKIEEPTVNHKKKKEEEDLMNLINTITQIEAVNKEKYSKEVSDALDLLELGEEDSTVEQEIKKEISQEKEESEELKNNEESTDEFTIDLEEDAIHDDDTKEERIAIEELNENEEVEEEPEEIEEPTEDIEITKEQRTDVDLTKVNVDVTSYDDFKDIDNKDASSIVIKLIIFLVIISVIIGAIYILNNVLNLGLF